MNGKIIWHHVGGRNSNDKFPLPADMRGLVHAVFYDADPDAADSAQNILPYCVLDEEKDADFHVTAEPSVSSIFPFNEDFGDFVRLTPEGYDEKISYASKTVRKIRLKSVTVDSLCAKGEPPPDILTIVAMGSSWEILKGAENTLKNHTLCVYADLEMLPVYRNGHRLFDESFRLLTECGFRFAFFSGFRRWRPEPQPLGARGPGFDVVGKAVFFKPAEKLPHDKIILRKQAVIALTYGQFDLAFQCLERAADAPGDETAEGAALRDFTGEIWSAYMQLGDRRPRPAAAPEQAVSAASAEAKHPVAARFIRRGSRPFRLLRAMRDIARGARAAVTEAAQAPTALEAKLHERGFHYQAEDLRRIRLAEEKIAQV